MSGNLEDKEKCLEKLNEMQKYLPFLEFMIEKIKKKNNENLLECQLSKFQLLRSMIAEKNGKYSWDVIARCEDVIERLMSKLEYKEDCNKSKERLRDNKKVNDNQLSIVEKDTKNGMAGSLPQIPSSTTTTILVTSACSSILTTVSGSKSQESSSKTVDLIMKNLKISVESDQKRNADSEIKNEFLSILSGPDRSSEEKFNSDSLVKNLETNLDKDLDGFDLTECSSLSETDSSYVNSKQSNPTGFENMVFHRDVLSSSREKLLKSLQSKLKPCVSSHSFEVKMAEKEGDSSVSAFSKTQKSFEEKTKSDTLETRRICDSDKVNTSKASKLQNSHDVLSALSSFSEISESKNQIGTECESNLKRKLRQKLSEVICQVYRVPGKGMGGSLRSLKTTKDYKLNTEKEEEKEKEKEKEEEVLKRSNTSLTKSMERKEKPMQSFSSKKNENSSSYKHSKKNLNDCKSKIDENESHKMDKSPKGKKGPSEGKKSSESQSKKDESKSFELDNLDDVELQEFVKENVQSLPHLSKLNPEELRKVVKSSLLNKSELDLPETEEISTSSEGSLQDLAEFMIDVKNLSEKLKTSTEEDSKTISDEKKTLHLSKVSQVGAETKAQKIEDSSYDDEDYAARLIDETTPSFSTKKKKGLLELPLPITDDLFDDISSVESFDTTNSMSSNDIRDPRKRKTSCENWSKPNILELPKPDALTLGSHINPHLSRLPPYLSPNVPVDFPGRLQEKTDAWHLKSISTQEFPSHFSHFNRTLNESCNPSFGNPGSFPHVNPVYESARRNSYHGEPKSYAEYKRMKQRLSFIDSATKARPNLTEIADAPENEETEQGCSLKAAEKCCAKSRGPISKQKIFKSYHSNSSNRFHDDRRSQGQRRFSDQTENKHHQEETRKEEDDKTKKVGLDKRLSSDSEELVSPLEKLYETENKPKTGRGYGIQNFKIPKKVRETVFQESRSNESLRGPPFTGTEAVQRPLSSSQAEVETTKESDELSCGLDKVKENAEKVESTGEQKKDEDSATNGVCDCQSSVLETVTAHSNPEQKPEFGVLPKVKMNLVKDITNGSDFIQEKNFPVVEPKLDSVKKCEAQIAECDSSVESSSLNSTTDSSEKSTVVLKDEVTQEFVEALIRKSFQSGEGKLLLAQAKLFEEFARKLNSKKLKTIQKIINSESGSSSSSSNTSSDDEKKKKKNKKSEGGKDRIQKSKKRKKRGRKSKKYISSSSSSSEGEDNSEKVGSEDKDDGKIEKSDILSATSSKGKPSHDEKEFKSNEPISVPPVKTSAKGKKGRSGVDFGGCISKRRSRRKQDQKKLLEQFLNETPRQDAGTDFNSAQESEPKIKPRPKGKVKTELDRLHDDIRSMFISSGVVTATGQRMCRILKESGGNMNNLDIVKESAKMVEEERLKKVQIRGRIRNSRRNAATDEKRSRSQSSDKVTTRDHSTSKSQESHHEVASSDTSSRLTVELSKKQPFVVLQRADLNNFGYGIKISEDCISFRRGTGQNRAIRGRKWRSVAHGTRFPSQAILTRNVYLERNKRKCERLKNKKFKKKYSGKKLMDIVKNLPLRMAKMKHLEICERKNDQEEPAKKCPAPKKSLFNMSEEKRKLENIDLLNYAFQKKRALYPCKLCSHVTRNITGHYTAVHPDSEVLISRLCLAEARKAIADSRENYYDVTFLGPGFSPKVVKRKSKSPPPAPSVFQCRMCSNPKITDVNVFFTHVTTHTGEYLFECPLEDCPVKMSTRDYIKFHILTKHPKFRYDLYNKIKERYEFSNDDGNLFGFLCSECHFVQISQKNVEKHVLRQHSFLENVRIIKINMASNATKKVRKAGWQKVTDDTECAEEGEEKEEEEEAEVENEDKEGHMSMTEAKAKKKLKKAVTEVIAAVTADCSETRPPKSKNLLIRPTEEVGEEEGGGKVDGEPRRSAEGNESADRAEDSIEVDEGVDLKKVTETRGSNLIAPLENAEKGGAISRSNPDRESLIKLKVGPLEAQMLDNSVALYECYVKGCLFSTKVFDLFEKHVKISHWKTKWDGKCEVCSEGKDLRMWPRTRKTKLLLALKHLKVHENEERGADNSGTEVEALKTSAKENQEETSKFSKKVAIEELSPEGRGEEEEKEEEEEEEEDEENGTEAEAEREKAPFPVKPLLRVRNLLGDRLSRQRESGEENEVVSSEQDLNAVETSDASMMFTIENVRSLKENSEARGGEIQIAQVCSAEDMKDAEKSGLGQPVIVRSCPTRKIAIRPEVSPLSIEVGHRGIVPGAPVAGSVLLSPISSPSSVRLLSSLSPLRGSQKAKFSVQPIMVSAPSFMSGSNVVSVIRSVTSPPKTSPSLSYDSPVVTAVETEPDLSQILHQAPKVNKTGGEGRKSSFRRGPPRKSPTGGTPEIEDAEEKDAKMLQRLHSRPDIKNKSVKDLKVYQEMLTKKKLCHLFKCMAIECSFTCNDDVVFTQHIGLHEAQRRMKNQKKGGKAMYIESGNKMKKVFNWQQCAYCCEVLINNSYALSQHVLTEHGHCIYQCAYCFYRAMSQSYVEIHQNLAHSQILKTGPRVIYKCKPLSATPPLASALEKHGRRQSVRPYQCDQCGSKFFITQEFMNHLVKEHQAVTAYTCHICKNLCFKADRLIVHYKLHSYCTFQCAYCLHGTETQKEMLFHLCNFHFSQPAYMYVRALAEGHTASDEVIKRPNKKKKSSSSQLDSLKVVVYESDTLTPDCIVEADPEEEKEDDAARESPSQDFSAIVAELGINAENESANVSPLIKELASIGNRNTENLTVKSLLPNAQFSSESENAGESCSVLISSGLSLAPEDKDDKEMNIPLGQLPLEAVNVQRKENSSSSLPKNIGSPDKNLKLNEIIVNFHNKEKTFAVPNAEENGHDSGAPKPSSAVHKLPPVVLSRSSCPKKVYPPKTANSVKKKPEEAPQGGETPDGNTILYQILNGKEEELDSNSGDRQKRRGSKGSQTSSADEKHVPETCTQPLITSVVSLAETEPSVDHPKPSNESIIITDVCSLESNAFSNSGFVLNIKSQISSPALLKPPIIRVEDFPIEDNVIQIKGLTNKVECGDDSSQSNAQTKAQRPECDKKSEEVTSPRSPDIIILEHEKTVKDIETVILDSEDEKEESGCKVQSVTKPEQPSTVAVADETIRKEMERLRRKIASETDSLLFDDSEESKAESGQFLSEEPRREEADPLPETLSPIEEAISSLNEKLKSEVIKRKEDEKQEEGKKSNGIEKNKSDLPRTRSGARIRKEDFGDEGKKEDAGKSKKFKDELTGKELYICGNEKCNFSAETDTQLKDHLYVCDLSRESSVLVCPHCLKQIKLFHPYLEHIKYHGEKKFHCGLCPFSTAVDTSVSRHVKQKHKCSAVKLLTKDPEKEGHFVCYPKNYKLEKGDSEMNTYSPGDEDKLPLQSVYQVNVKCAKCPYFTKVRSNMVRHLKIHAKSVETEGVVVVPSTAPTNPVPCLEKKERMFDKMTNLAASSQLAQAKEKTAFQTLSPEEEAKLPQFVAEQMRYKCCLPDCNYITIDDGMLKHHIKALHDEINYYSCPHCLTTVHVDVRHVTLDKIGHHLKHHDSKLYKCAHCNYFHFLKSVVEKHVVEKHPDRRYFVYTVREPKPEVTSEEEHSSSEGGAVSWKCGLCIDFQSPSRAALMDHLGKSHNTKSKYKCQLCFMKSNTYQAFFAHFASKHAGEKVQYVKSMIKVTSGNVECQSGNSSGADSSNEHFDTTPLWQRGAPRVRHIRGILIEEEEVKTKKSKRMSVENETEGEVSEAIAVKENAFCCPLCSDKKKLFFTRSEDCFRSHLYQELNYQQFACMLCGKMFVDRKEYEKHHSRTHPEKPPSLKLTKEDGEITFWVDKVIAKQREEMKGSKRRLSESDSNESPGLAKKKKEL